MFLDFVQFIRQAVDALVQCIVDALCALLLVCSGAAVWRLPALAANLQFGGFQRRFVCVACGCASAEAPGVPERPLPSSLLLATHFWGKVPLHRTVQPHEASLGPPPLTTRGVDCMGGSLGLHCVQGGRGPTERWFPQERNVWGV